MKQTAVKWLFQELWETPQDKFRWHTILEQAKEMEKEQIKHAWCDGNPAFFDIFEQYYLETYGGDK